MGVPVVLCEICGSMFVGARCRNGECGYGNHVKWAKNDRKFRNDIARGNDLITAQRDKLSDLGGPKLGVALVTKEREEEMAVKDNDTERFVARWNELSDALKRVRLMAVEFKLPVSAVYNLARQYGLRQAIDAKDTICEDLQASEEPAIVVSEAVEDDRPKVDDANNVTYHGGMLNPHIDLMLNPPIDRNSMMIHDMLDKLASIQKTLPSEDRHRMLLDQLHDTYIRKNADYGDSFHSGVELFGIQSALTRMYDKWNRILSLQRQPSKIPSESMRDTLLDLSNYCVMTVMELDAIAAKELDALMLEDVV